MPVFDYIGLRQDGTATTGIIDADSSRNARLKLRRDGVYPTTVVEQRLRGTRDPKTGFAFQGRSLPTEELAILTQQLATLLQAGLPFVDALGILIEQSDRAQTKGVLANLKEQVREGKTFSSALEKMPEHFSGMYIPMIQAGEASGGLEQVLFRLADILDYQLELKRKVVDATLYPLIMLGVGVTVLMTLVTFVVPQITAVFADLGQALPWPTLFLISISHFLRDYILILGLCLLLLVVLFRRFQGTPYGRLRIDRCVLNLPLFGHIVTKTAIARFTKTLSTLLASGIPLLEALAVSKGVLNNSLLEQAIEHTRGQIREGHTIADPLKLSGVFPPLVTHLIQVGEKSGELEGMLSRTALIYDREVEKHLTRITALLGPCMILLMGGVVLFIVVAILLPIFQMSEMVGS